MAPVKKKIFFFTTIHMKKCSVILLVPSNVDGWWAVPKHSLLHFPQCTVWDMLTHFWCAGRRSAALSCFSPWLASVAVGGGQTRRKTGSTDRQTDRKQAMDSWTALTLCFILAQLARLSLQRLCMVTLQADTQTDSVEVRNMLLILNCVLLQIFIKYYNIVLRDTSGFGFSQ